MRGEEIVFRRVLVVGGCGVVGRERLEAPETYDRKVIGNWEG